MKTNTEKEHIIYDAVIIGGGPCGSTLGQLLAKAGKKVAIIEKSHFPRFHIGESLLPATVHLMEELGLGDYLNNIAIKKPGGIWIYGYTGRGKELFTGGCFADCTRQASFYDKPHAYMVERATFDQLLLDKAKESGAEIYTEHAVTGIIGSREQVNGITVKDIRDDKDKQFKAKMVYDCSGIAAVLGKTFNLRHENDLRRLAVFGHFNYQPVHTKLQQGFFVGNVIKNGWSWYIPLSKTKVSIGVVTPATNVRQAKLSPQDFLFSELKKIKDFDKIMLADFKLSGDVKMVANFGATSEKIIGNGWALVGDAAFFIDPCFSSGVHLTMFHAQKLAKIYIEHAHEIDTFNHAMELNKNDMFAYVDNIKRVVDTFYATTQSKLAYDLSPLMFFGPAKSMFLTVLGGDFEKHIWFMKLANGFMRFIRWFDQKVLKRDASLIEKNISM